MSASPLFSAAATGRPFIFSPSSAPRSHAGEAGRLTAEIVSRMSATPKLAALVPASRLAVRPAPEMVPSGIPSLDALSGGFARGCLTEICGAASSGRTSVLLSALARATQRGEVCALVDSSDALDPASAAAAGMEMSRLLWVRCGKQSPARDLPSSPAFAAAGRRNEENFFPARNPEPRRWESSLTQMLKVTDLLLQSNGFGMIALDLGDVPAQSTRRIPLASWFRFRRVIEQTPTVLLVVEQQSIAGSCSSVLLKVSGDRSQEAGKFSALGAHRLQNHPSHAELLHRFEITVELLHSRIEQKSERKPVQSVTSFKSRAAWA